ncbi:MAG TPA: hypothetical protein VF637_00380, partial [Sphingomicrobium sp.]
QLQRDPSLNIPEPPPLPEELTDEAPKATKDAGSTAKPWAYQVQIVSPDPQTYNFAVAHIRTLSNVDQAQVVGVNIGGISYVHVTFRGDLSALASALGARGWTVENLGGAIRISGNAGPPKVAPAQPPPTQPAQLQGATPRPPQQQPAQSSPATTRPAPASPQ